MEWTTFIGRFHPLLVHLPIGFLLLGIVLDVVAKRRRKEQWAEAIEFIYLLGAGSAVAAAICGWLLAIKGGYNDSSLFWHRWLGTGIAVLSTVLYLAKAKSIISNKRVEQGLVVSLFGLLLLTGHLGGNLTHGANYLLEYAPFFNGSSSTSRELALTAKDPEEVQLYHDLVFPILQQKCLSCHNMDKQNGGLNMATVESLQAGGDGGPVLVAQHPEQSELFHRVTMNPKAKEFMPPKGTPLSYREIQLLEWWIASGASFEQTVAEVEVPERVKAFVLEQYGLDTKGKPFTEKMQVAPLAADVLTQLEQAGFKVEPVAENNNFLAVRYTNKSTSPTETVLNYLLQAKEQIAYLDLSGLQLTDESLISVGQLPNLVHLKLEQTPITDIGIQHLEHLKNLELLNLYGTLVSDNSAARIAALPALKKVFLWQTQVTETGISIIHSQRPEIEVVQGIPIAELPNEMLNK